MSKPRDYVGKAPIYQKWDEKAFQFDTAHMHWQARLLFKDLLQKAMHLSTRPDLPDDDEQLINILRVPKEVWDQYKVSVRAMFKSDVGILWQKRLRGEWQDLYMYRREQKKRADKRWAHSNGLKTQPVDATALPPQSHGNASRVEKSISEENIDDSGPSPAADASGYPERLSGETPESPAAPSGKKTDVDALTSFIYEKTKCVPPDRKAVSVLLQQFSLVEIKRAFTGFVADKPSAKMVGAIRVFFQHSNAASIIDANLRGDWLDGLKYFTDNRIDDQTADEFTEFKSQPIPSGIPNADALLAKASAAVEKWKSKNKIAEGK